MPAIRASRCTPALLTRIWTGPAASSGADGVLHLRTVARSKATALACPPCATSSCRERLRAVQPAVGMHDHVQRRAAARARQMAVPMPPLPPVTRRAAEGRRRCSWRGGAESHHQSAARDRWPVRCDLEAVHAAGRGPAEQFGAHGQQRRRSVGMGSRAARRRSAWRACRRAGLSASSSNAPCTAAACAAYSTATTAGTRWPSRASGCARYAAPPPGRRCALRPNAAPHRAGTSRPRAARRRSICGAVEHHAARHRVQALQHCICPAQRQMLHAVSGSHHPASRAPPAPAHCCCRPGRGQPAGQRRCGCGRRGSQTQRRSDASAGARRSRPGADDPRGGGRLRRSAATSSSGGVIGGS